MADEDEEATMSDTDRGQVTATAAEVYDGFFVPALFGQWTDTVLDEAGVAHDERVLDVGCGTGVLACAAHRRVGPGGHVAAVDPNDGMLAVARRAEPGVDWRRGVAEDLPFTDGSFDRTVSQFALMFFTEPAAALAEIARVTRRDGSVALAVWDRFELNAGYARLAVLLDELFGPAAAESLRVPFALGDERALAALCTPAIAAPTVTRRPGVARFESLTAWLHTEIRGWTLADVIDDDGFDRLLEAATDQLRDLVDPGGAVTFDVSALVVSGPPG